jgi:sugar phosphate isomerase/epimerase
MRSMMVLMQLTLGMFLVGFTMLIHTDASGEDGRFPGFTVGVQSYCFRNFNLDETLRNTQELALTNIEFYGAHVSHDMSPQQLDEIKKKLTDARIKMVAYGVVGFGPDEAANEKIFKFAKEMGFDVITADPAPESLDNLNELVQKYDIKIAIHNHGPGSRYSLIEDVEKAVKGRDKRIGLCIDNGHFQRSKVDSIQVVQRFPDRIHAVHIKDPNNPGQDQILGKGAANIPGLLKALKKAGFQGPFNLEYEIEPDNPVGSMKKCLHYLSKVCKEIE